MDSPFRFKKNETEEIINRFGEDFHNKVLRDIEVYADKWNLTSFQFIPSYSANLVFKCYSDNLGNAVLKIGNPSFGEIFKEFYTLSEYNGKRFCRVFKDDIKNGVILEERVQPGQPLRAEKSLDKRLAIFCSLYKGLHIPPTQEDIYPTYIEWVDRITDYMSRRNDCQELYGHMKKAREICSSLSALYSQKVLLHGDFHHDNILLGKDSEYVIIDPKGVIGDPVFDVSRFILNEFDDEKDEATYKKINHIIHFFEKELHIPEKIIRQCLYVETVMGVCWCIEDGEEYTDFIKDIALAESILNEKIAF
ncbi:hypothetical protein J14TS2_24420 [Bacillus sp. J14TS2]|uniref:aminoglycoside phosphotransferase family protein n=1 Tax=Bacillus sp. J14TS2 TaxID=2807188 RepID=UPI001B25ADBE|nr:aminoglycoside phosphotransferase family protein [Bacillus sp. J14TS2]GIN71967.1 hypothetical protein J14TS2_24420 [Bacillus sp. J14TS2]